MILVARIAENILESEAPNSLAAANTELAILAGNSLMSDEGDHPFTECATFADDIKGEGYSFQSGWHYIDQPLMLDDSELSDSNFVMDDEDILHALIILNEWLLDSGPYKETSYYQQIMDKGWTDTEGRSFALRMMIHFVGDIH